MGELFGAPGGEIRLPPPPPPQSPQEKAFLERLRAPSRPAPMPDMTGMLDHSGHMPSERQVDSFTGTRIDQKALQPFLDLGETGPAKITFRRNQLLEAGRDKTVHGTFLGRMRMASADGQTATNHLVAVKPFFLQEGGKAAQEVGLLQYATKLGLKAVKPLMVVVDHFSEVKRLFLVTEFSGELSTLVSQDWRNLQPDEVGSRLQPVVDTLIALHGKGILHGDPQFKNIGTGDAAGKPIIHDLEEGVSVRDLLEHMDPDKPVPEQLVWRLMQDFKRVQISMREYVYPNLPEDQRPDTSMDRFMFEYGAFLENYHRALNNSDTPYRAALNRAYETVVERLRQYASEGREPLLPEGLQQKTDSN